MTYFIDIKDKDNQLIHFHHQFNCICYFSMFRFATSVFRRLGDEQCRGEGGGGGGGGRGRGVFQITGLLKQQLESQLYVCNFIGM